MGFNPAGSVHARLSQKRLADQHEVLREQAKKPATRAEAFRRAFHRDMVGGMKGARQVGSPLTLGADGLLGTCRAKGPELSTKAEARERLAQIKEYPCSFGATGVATGGITAAANLVTAGTGAVVGTTLGWAGGILVPRKQGAMMRYGAAGGILASAPLLYGYAYANYGVREGAGLLASAPKLMLNGVGAAAGGVVGLARGTKAALRFKKR